MQIPWPLRQPSNMQWWSETEEYHTEPMLFLLDFRALVFVEEIRGARRHHAESSCWPTVSETPISNLFGMQFLVRLRDVLPLPLLDNCLDE